MKQKLAISYVRFSTMGQSDGDSIRRQTEATEAYELSMEYGSIQFHPL
ncbi:MAG: hypothetical protein ABSH38_04820 [Verrucomicrobiota bacterium]|jgi:DNA invertase Pin-like site-specific DNA recombinase